MVRDLFCCIVYVCTFKPPATWEEKTRTVSLRAERPGAEPLTITQTAAAAAACLHNAQTTRSPLTTTKYLFTFNSHVTVTDIRGLGVITEEWHGKTLCNVTLSREADRLPEQLLSLGGDPPSSHQTSVYKRCKTYDFGCYLSLWGWDSQAHPYRAPLHHSTLHRLASFTYFSLACASEGTDEPFPLAYMLNTVL